MTERPTPEQIEDIRKAVAVAFDLSHEQPSDVLAEWVVSLLAEVDAPREEMRNLDVVEEHNAELRKNALPSNCTRCNGKGAEPPGCPESGPCERCGGWTSHKRLIGVQIHMNNGTEPVIVEVPFADAPRLGDRCRIVFVRGGA